ncbi:Uncharacterised protein [Chlamydia trachomatis]|nr:Uncharacterised protein [Chlamydia trachomatis]
MKIRKENFSLCFDFVLLLRAESICYNVTEVLRISLLDNFEFESILDKSSLSTDERHSALAMVNVSS